MKDRETDIEHMATTLKHHQSMVAMAELMILGKARFVEAHAGYWLKDAEIYTRAEAVAKILKEVEDAR